MEKKTIGKFISALRKSNGMTQKELGEKLFVSDKTVSRWECDECTPDLSLIPAIAEIFGITADELLRGERNNPERATGETAEERRKEKSEKQFHFILERTGKRHQNFSMISIGITILGLIAAMIANLAFSKGWIAFFLALAFCTASEICQICFTVNARFSMREEDGERADQLRLSNNKVMKTAVEISFFNLSAIAFCLPLFVLLETPDYGLKFDSWLLFGALFSFAAFILASVFYTLQIRTYLCKRGLFEVTQSEADVFAWNRKLLLKTVAVSLATSFVLGICVLILEGIGWRGLAKKEVFDNCGDFKAFMENQYDTWYEEGYTYYDKENGAVVIVPGEDISGVSPMKEYGKIINSEGETICEYYFHHSLNRSIRFTESAEDKMPVTVITMHAYTVAIHCYDFLHLLLYGLMVLDVMIAFAFYLRKMKRV